MAVVVAYGMAQEDQTSLHPFFLTGKLAVRVHF